MKIGIIGVGNVGRTLGVGLAKKGHHVVFGSRPSDGNKIEDLAKSVGENAKAAPIPEVAAQTDIIILATPWVAAQEAIQNAGNLSGKILIDTTNPIIIGSEELKQGLLVGHTTSAAEQIAAWAPDARVVKAFNTIGAELMDNPRFGSQQATMFYCGDDAEAKSTVATLVTDLSFEAEDAGPLVTARLLEPMAMLWIFLANGYGWGSNFAFKVLRR